MGRGTFHILLHVLCDDDENDNDGDDDGDGDMRMAEKTTNKV